MLGAGGSGSVPVVTPITSLLVICAPKLILALVPRPCRFRISTPALIAGELLERVRVLPAVFAKAGSVEIEPTVSLLKVLCQLEKL